MKRANARAHAFEHIGLIAWLAFELTKGAQVILTGTVEAASAIVIAAIAVMLWGTLRRPPPLHMRADVWTIVPCLISVCALTLALQHAPSADGGLTSTALQMAGSALMLWSALALGSRFTILPTAISAITSGPYRLVRHPLYVSYILFDLGLAIDANAPLVWCALALEAAAFMTRARQEEAVLLEHLAEYRAYADSLRWRYIPFVL